MPARIKYAWVLTVLLWPASALAIVNMEEVIIGQPPEGVSGSLHAASEGVSGNADRLSSSVDGRLQWQHAPHTDILALSYAYGTSQGVPNSNKAFAHLRHRIRMSPLWSAEGFVQAERDEFARLSFRGLAGAGIRLTVMEGGQRIAAYLGLGAFYEREKLAQAAGAAASLITSLWRGNGYLTLKYNINGQVRILSTSYIQPAFQNTGDFRLLERAAVLVKLSDNLDLKMSLDLLHDSQPPQQVKRTDITYATGIQLKF
jgi:hypothetical protein